MHDDAVDRAGVEDDVTAINLHDVVIGQGALVGGQCLRILARLAAPKAADQHHLVDDYGVGVGVVRAAAPTGRAVHRVAT